MARFEGAFGSFQYKEGNASFSGSKGPWSASLYSNAINSDGYRDNNFYRQLNGVGDLRYTYEQGSVLPELVGRQFASRPAGRAPGRAVHRIESTGRPTVAARRRRSTMPIKNGRNATVGMTRMLAPGAELIVDGGIRNKTEKAEFHGNFADPASSTPLRAVDTELTTASLTPRLKLDATVGGMRLAIDRRHRLLPGAIQFRPAAVSRRSPDPSFRPDAEHDGGLLAADRYGRAKHGHFCRRPRSADEHSSGRCV